MFVLYHTVFVSLVVFVFVLCNTVIVNVRAHQACAKGLAGHCCEQIYSIHPTNQPKVIQVRVTVLANDNLVCTLLQACKAKD